MDSVLSIRLTVSGKVQGVFFRQSASDVANKLGLSGFVQNLPNGDVLIEVHGIASNVEELYQWSLKGPMLAHVKSVHREEIPSISLTGIFVLRKA
ncbi:MAG: acylphosphatase [Bacteroidetes bacterium]|jgi:acylphosphatase|nr:acylphosphatase [Bacteroidota bacterium]